MSHFVFRLLPVIKCERSFFLGGLRRMAITCLHSGPVGSFPKFIRVPKIIAFGTPGCNTGGFRKDVRGGHFGKIWIQKIGLGFGETGMRSGEEGMLRCSYCSVFTSVRIRKVERYVQTRL